ncbi:MAG TPA: long-chain fatty acid--CoA ligase [Methyloceanibacter sp.]|jgi:long-chain acyl-CoA synthetase|nr:long-chain fatty acid--CoA ligase [Methyloceanibacter sp.]
MARKPRSATATIEQPSGARPKRPWLKSYPEGLNWEAHFEPALLGTLLERAVQNHGTRPCTYFMGKRLSYAEIGALSDRAAKGLQAIGVSEGVKVGLLLPNTPTFLIFYYAVLKAGGIVVNFNPLYSLEEIAFQIRDSDTKVMVTLDLALLFDKVEAMLERGVLEKAVVASFPELLPRLKSVGFKFLQRAKLANPSASRVKDRIVTEEALLANDGRYRRPAIAPEAIAVLQYTGGTTGTPKGAMLSHANLTVNVGQVTLWQNRQAAAHDRILGVLPLFHVFAMTTIMNYGIARGMELILLPRFELGTTLKLIGKLRPTIMPGVPTLYNALLHHPKLAKTDLSSLEYCISGGAALPLEVKRGFEAVAGCGLVEGYGLSETAPVATCNPVLNGKEGSIGLPLPATEISIRSLEDPTQEMPMGEPGEICIAGPQVMPGYWNKPQETEASFVGNYFRSGDVGYMDEDGYTFIVDRIKDMINCSGFKVYPRRVEDALYAHGAVAEATVVGIPDAYRGEVPKAFVKLKEGMAATAGELHAFLAEKLSKFELPAEIEFRDELPKTNIGKLSKKELRAEARRQTR